MAKATLVPTIQLFWSHVFRKTTKPHIFHRLSRNVGLTYREVGARAASMMDYLFSCGIKTGDNIAILSWDCVEADIVKLAAETVGASVTIIYPSYDSNLVGYILKHSGSCMLFADTPASAAKASNLVPTRLLKKADGTADDAQPNNINDIIAHCSPDRILTYIQAQLQIAESGQGNFCNIALSDRKRIVYTSGTSGDPKGVALTHGNYAFACWAVLQLIKVNPSDVLLDFLPWAHIFGDFLHEIIIVSGAISACIPPTPKSAVVGGIKEFDPSVFGSVPAFYNAAMDKILGLPGFKGKLVNLALSIKLNGWPWPFSAMADRILNKVLRQALGPNMHLALTGAAATPPKVFQVFSAMGLDIQEGYGLTEAMPVTINAPGQRKVGSVGKLLPGMESRIVPYKDDTDAADNKATVDRETVDVDPKNKGPFEAGYSYMTVNGKTVVVGEIQVRGPNVFTEYLNNPEETAKSFEVSNDLDVDGNPKGNWFKTGDLGYIDDEGYHYLYGGRIGRMYKISGGKKVYPEVVETGMKSPIIEHCVCVGKDRPYNILLVLLNREKVAELLADEAKSDPSVLNADKAAKHPKIIAAVQAAVDEGNKKVQSWEECRDSLILPVYALEAGYVTGSQKPKYKVIEKVNQPQIDEKYAQRKK